MKNTKNNNLPHKVEKERPTGAKTSFCKPLVFKRLVNTPYYMKKQRFFKTMFKHKFLRQFLNRNK